MAFFDDYGRFGSSPAVIDGDTVLSWTDIDEYSGFFRSRIKERCLVFCFCENTAGCIAGYLAMLNNRIVPLMLDHGLDGLLARHLIKLYHPSYIYIPESMDGFSDLETEVVFVRCGYRMLRVCGADDYGKYELYPELALLLTTSGSTGSPKLVRQSYENICANAASIAEYLELSASERPVTSLPMHYTYGLSIVQSHALVGACIVCTKHSVIQKEFWDTVKECHVTSLAGVPYTYEMLKRIHFFRMELPCLKTLTQAGGKLAPELHHEFASFAMQKGIRFFVMYGQTEATARMAYLPWEKALEKSGSMGVAIPGGGFELIDENGSVISEAGRIGELVYTGANVTLGYANCGDDLKKGDERNGRLKTGDMAKRDEDGFYYIVGRKKRFLKIFGSHINLDETEGLISSRFPELACACAGSDDQLCVYMTDKEKEEAVHAFLQEKLHINQRAVRIIVIDEIPRNESGKTLYRELPEPEIGKQV